VENDIAVYGITTEQTRSLKSATSDGKTVAKGHTGNDVGF